MPEPDARSAQLAEEFEESVGAFRALVESLTGDQWQMTGRNHPTIHVGDEDEHRPVGVIAWHAAESIGNQLRWVRTMADGEQPQLPDRGYNARQEVERAAVTKAEVLAQLDEVAPKMAAMIRSFSAEELERRARTMAGEQSVADTLRRVVIGHPRWHQGSIEATVGGRP